jgi:hypothetical protein
MSLVVDVVLEPVSAYSTMCGPASDCASGYTVFRSTINKRGQCLPTRNLRRGLVIRRHFQLALWKHRSLLRRLPGRVHRLRLLRQPILLPSCVECVAGCDGGPSCDRGRARWNCFRYGKCNQEIACSGPVACRVVTCVLRGRSAGWLAPPTSPPTTTPASTTLPAFSSAATRQSGCTAGVSAAPCRCSGRYPGTGGHS